MKVQKFIAPTAGEALREAKASLGDNALILSSRQTPRGVELLAMAEAHVDEIVAGHATHESTFVVPTPTVAAQAKPQPATPRTAARRLQSSEEMANAPLSTRGPVQTLKAFLKSREASRPVIAASVAGNRPEQRVSANTPSETQPNPVASSPSPAVGEPIRRAPESVSAARDSVRPATAPPITPRLDPAVLDELKSMRHFIAGEMARLSWAELPRRSPLKAQMLRTLLCAGFSAAVARHIVEHLPDDVSSGEARERVQRALARNIAVADESEEIVAQGGVFALVGPTGVGKTTTAAKIAARYVVRNGASSLGLITTDNYRIGAQDQLRAYGQILGVPVYTAPTAPELRALLELMRGKRLVLIDTIGMSQRDQRVREQEAILNADGVKRVLLLNAASQSETLEEVIHAYRGRSLSGCLITKVDEAARLGGVLDAVIRHRFRVQYMSTGQKVPEDLHLPHAAFLTHRALAVKAEPQFELNDEEIGLMHAARSPQTQASLAELAYA